MTKWRRSIDCLRHLWHCNRAGGHQESSGVRRARQARTARTEHSEHQDLLRVRKSSLDRRARREARRDVPSVRRPRHTPTNLRSAFGADDLEAERGLELSQCGVEVAVSQKCAHHLEPSFLFGQTHRFDAVAHAQLLNDDGEVIANGALRKKKLEWTKQLPTAGPFLSSGCFGLGAIFCCCVRQ